jgi:subfamily B ATP-binding cassette protein MsbA
VDVLLRIHTPSSGQITIDGSDIFDMDIYAYRGLFGVVTQETVLFNDTIAENISLSNSNLNNLVIEALKNAYADEFVNQLPDGINHKIGDQGHKLSGGQRQRLAIARAIIHNPPILVLDEATSALDSTSESKVQQSLDQAMKGRTSIIIAHRLSTVQKADIIYVMHEGKIVEQGDHQNLILHGMRYKALIKDQFI